MGCPICGHEIDPFVIRGSDTITVKKDKLQICRVLGSSVRYIHEPKDEENIDPVEVGDAEIKFVESVVGDSITVSW